MFKLITYAVLSYLAYRVFFEKPKKIERKSRSESDQVIDIDYEEIKD